MSSIFGTISVGLNIEFLALMIAGVFIIYLIGMIYYNTYTNFSAKDLGRLSMISYILGVLTVAYLVGSTFFTLVSLGLAIIFVAGSIFRMKKKSKKSVASRINGGN